jgi:hypothetical protein
MKTGQQLSPGQQRWAAIILAALMIIGGLATVVADKRESMCRALLYHRPVHERSPVNGSVPEKVNGGPTNGPGFLVPQPEPILPSPPIQAPIAANAEANRAGLPPRRGQTQALPASASKGRQRLGKGLVRSWNGQWGVEGPVGTAGSPWLAGAGRVGSKKRFLTNNISISLRPTAVQWGRPAALPYT